MNIAVSCGDTNGIGLELFLQALTLHPELTEKATYLLYIHPSTLQEAIDYLGFASQIHGNECWVIGETRPLFSIFPLSSYAPYSPGVSSTAAARLALESLEKTAEDCVKKNTDAVVTLPVSKTSLADIGFPFPGQTEFFADRSGGNSPLMMLFHEQVRVALATVHLPLQNVPSLLNVQHIESNIAAIITTLQRDFGVAKPRIAVLGLNPHAGENGLLGKEEITIIAPAVDAFAANSSAIVKGPFAADGFFAHGDYKNYDAILAMYHDQGLIPLKLLAQGGGVNFTANIPIVRVSPDHGTAYHLAGKGLADYTATYAALRWANLIASARK